MNNPTFVLNQFPSTSCPNDWTLKAAQSLEHMRVGSFPWTRIFGSKCYRAPHCRREVLFHHFFSVYSTCLGRSVCGKCACYIPSPTGPAEGCGRRAVKCDESVIGTGFTSVLPSVRYEPSPQLHHMTARLQPSAWHRCLSDLVIHPMNHY